MLLNEAWQRGFAHKLLKLWELLKAELSLPQATPDVFQTEDAKTVITDPSQSGHLTSQKRPWLHQQQRGCWAEEDSLLHFAGQCSSPLFLCC